MVRSSAAKLIVCEPIMREYHRRIVRFLEDEGCGGVAIVHDSRHPRVVFNRNGREYRHPVAGSPGCEYRAVRNIITQLKRVMKEKAKH